MPSNNYMNLTILPVTGFAVCAHAGYCLLPLA